jgi:hypothetical protein
VQLAVAGEHRGPGGAHRGQRGGQRRGQLRAGVDVGHPVRARGVEAHRAADDREPRPPPPAPVVLGARQRRQRRAGGDQPPHLAGDDRVLLRALGREVDVGPVAAAAGAGRELRARWRDPPRPGRVEPHQLAARPPRVALGHAHAHAIARRGRGDEHRPTVGILADAVAAGRQRVDRDLDVRGHAASPTRGGATRSRTATRAGTTGVTGHATTRRD